MPLKISEYWKSLGAEKGIEIRIGVTTGYCTVGNFGSEMRLDYTVLGSPVNLASRLQSNAKPNSICISETTYNLVKEYFNCHEVDEIIPKGFVRPIKIYAINNKITKEISELNRIKKLGKYFELKIDKVENIDELLNEMDEIKSKLNDLKLIKK